MHFKHTYPTPKEHTRGANTCEYIVVHHTGTNPGTIKGVLDGLYRRDDYASCHYCVDINGDVYKIGNDTDILWHAGVSYWDGRDGMNKYSIGIEVIGIDSFTEEQKVAVKALVLDLMETHKIPKQNVVRHADVAPGRKTDIHLNFCAPLTWSQWQASLTNNTMPEFDVKKTAADWGVEAQRAVKWVEEKGIFSEFRSEDDLRDAIKLYRTYLASVNEVGERLKKLWA